jgi:hypothetical protein
MKKIIAIASMALVLALVFMTSCKKDTSAPVDQKQYVKAIAGSFIAKDGDITLKSAPVSVNRTWSMYARNSSFYGNAPYALVNGSEFITGSAAYNFWHNSANNPVTFGASEVLYSNLTPDEDLRLITESKDAANNVAYLGIIDFNPNTASFPLTVNSFRLGDVLTLNTDAITGLPGGGNLTITAAFSLAPVDLAATKMGPITLPGGTPNGNQLQWSDIIYGAPVPTNVTVGAGDFVLYDGLDKKVMGNIVITITEVGNGGSVIVLPAIAAKGPGKGLKLTLKTTKIGWYDSGTINFSETDIIVVAEDVWVN